MSKKPSTGTRAILWLFILGKFAKLAKLAKFAKIAKPLITVVTMSISAVAYAFWLGPWFAIGLVMMLFIHEMGHVAAMRMRGYKASAPVFIPFLGAVIFGPRMTGRDDEAFIGIGGPVLGGLAAAIALGAWYFVDDKKSDLAIILMMVSYVGMFINVFNLIPIRPLDGGRVTQAVGPWFKYVGIVALAILSAMFHEPVILFVWIVVMPEITFLPLSLRAVMAVLLWLVMVVLMMMGYSNQPYWVDIVDGVCAGLLALAIVAQAVTNTDPASEDDDRPHLEHAQRVAWFILYAALTIILIGLMAFQIQQLPTTP